MQMNFLLSCARGHESKKKKQYTRIIKAQKICEKKLVHWSPDFYCKSQFISLLSLDSLTTAWVHAVKCPVVVQETIVMFITRSTGAVTAYVNVFRDLTTSLDSC